MSKSALGSLHFPSAGSKLCPKRSPVFAPLGVLQTLLAKMVSCGERMRKVGIIASRAVLIEIDGDWEGRCQVPAVDIANEEGRLSWTDFLEGQDDRSTRSTSLDACPQECETL
jgi:hypothetical protein